MKLEDLYSKDYEESLEKFYMRAWKFICDGKSLMLQPIWLKIPKKQQFYSKTDKMLNFLGPTWLMYLISEKKDDKDRVMVYAPYSFYQGKIFLVPEELVIRLGYN